MELMKFRLSFLVAFSCGFGYLLAGKSNTDWGLLFLVSLGGFLVSGGSIVINQIIERKIDLKMDRTKNRPLPTSRVSVFEALVLSTLSASSGLVLLWMISNPLTVFLSFVSLVLYGFVYTPLKRVGPVAVFVGAIPGALPPLLGWVAATGVISHEALIIFGIQFIWQFPHFWAIAWLAYDDYKKVGIKLLPAKGEK
ncbi:MAG: heme o synthase, partial [Cyclobacteriaceae bacterium]|nr:heme o synthase [Cyclobacteriaceae bacterium]